MNAMISNRYIYKISSTADWKTAEESGVFTGAAIDITDGYIHFSTAEQAAETLALHFAGQADLVLAAIDTTKLETAIIYEESRGGKLFPHLYSDLNMKAVAWVKSIAMNDDGSHIMPDVEEEAG